MQKRNKENMQSLLQQKIDEKQNDYNAVKNSEMSFYVPESTQKVQDLDPQQAHNISTSLFI